MELLLVFILTILFATTNISENTGLIFGIFWIEYVFITALIRRLHDLDKTGWLSLIMFIPIINFIFIIYCGCIKGTTGANRFGKDPLENEKKM